MSDEREIKTTKDTSLATYILETKNLLMSLQREVYGLKLEQVKYTGEVAGTIKVLTQKVTFIADSVQDDIGECKGERIIIRDTARDNKIELKEDIKDLGESTDKKVTGLYRLGIGGMFTLLCGIVVAWFKGH